jgi:FkbM family methyltransferase
MSLIGDIWRHPANRNRRFRALANGACWQIWKRFVPRPFTIRYHGYLLPCYPDSRQASAAIYFNNWPDFWEMRFIQDYLRPGDRFVDVGANIGLYSLLAARRVGESGCVVAFEPGEIPARRLEETCARNGIATVGLHRSAVGEASGILDFLEGGEDCTRRPAVGGERSASRQVPVVRLDDLLDDNPYAMAKLDIEGYEPIALRGMHRHLRVGNPAVLLVEAAGYSKQYGASTDELMGDLGKLGYNPYYYDPATRRVISAPKHWESGLTNVLCIRDLRKVQGRLEA